MPVTTPYSHESFPPKPVLNVRLSIPGVAPATSANSALIDTGSDFTLVPLGLLIGFGAPESRMARVRGLFSNSHAVTLYYVDLHLESGTLSGVEVIGVEGDDGFDSAEIILGRNVLNKLQLLIDGQGLTTHLLERLPRRF